MNPDHITTEWLLSVGCSVGHIFAYDVTGDVCVAERLRGEHFWQRWQNYKGEYPRPRFRVKAHSIPTHEVA